MSQALSLVTGTGDGSQNESMSVADYLTSHDVVSTLRRDDRLVERFSRPDADFFSRLRGTNPTPEKLFKYYGKQVSVKFASDTGITILKVHSFRPNDSYELVEKLLELGEKRVNMLNTRSYTDSISTSRRQLAQAEQDLAAVQGRLTAFRQVRNDIDPSATGQAQIGIISGLTAQLSAAKAQLAAVGSTIDQSSPQYQALSRRVAALQAQVSAQSSRLVGNSSAIASDISGFESLQMRQAFLVKRYEAAAASLGKGARAGAQPATLSRAGRRSEHAGEGVVSPTLPHPGDDRDRAVVDLRDRMVARGRRARACRLARSTRRSGDRAVAAWGRERRCRHHGRPPSSTATGC